MKIKITKQNHRWIGTAEDRHGNRSTSEGPTELIAGMNAAAGLPRVDDDWSNAIFRAMYANRLDSLEIALANITGHRDKLADGAAVAYLNLAALAVRKAIISQMKWEPKPEEPRMHSWDKEPESRASTNECETCRHKGQPDCPWHTKRVARNKEQLGHAFILLCTEWEARE